MANGDDTPAAPDYHESPYMMQRPDGSVESRVLHTDRPVTHGELSDYVASQGGVYLGPPSPPTTTTTTTAAPPTTTTEWQPPPPLPTDATDADRARRAWALGSYEPPDVAPPPAPTSPPPVPAPTAQKPPSLMQAFGGYDPGAGAALSQAFTPPAPPEMPSVRGVIAPDRTFLSQTPSIIGATIAGRLGTYAATPLGPEVAIPAGIVSASVGGGLGEGGRILYEKATGATPAEPGTAWHRMANAALRSATFEGLTAPLRALPIAVAASARPAADAMQELEPELTGQVAGPLTDWWAKWSARPAEEMAKEWAGMGAEQQATLAGDKVGAMRDLMATVARPISRGEAISYVGSLGGGWPAIHLSGAPGAVLAAYPAARAFVREATPAVMSSIARAGPESPWLLSLPQYAQTAGAMISPAVRGAAQSWGVGRWRPAETTLPPP